MPIIMSIDDVCPRKSYGTAKDFEILDWLRGRHPELRITLFVVPCMRLYPYSFLSKDRYRLDKHREWCQWLESKKGYEMAVHGYTHRSSRPPYSAEFNLLQPAEIAFRLEKAERILQKAGLSFVKGFRQPGWLAPDYLIDALIAKDYLFFAGSQDVITPVSKDATCSQSGFRGLSLIYPQKVRGLVHTPTNMGLDRLDLERALKIAELGGLVSIKAHMAPWDENGLTLEKVRRLDSLLHELEQREIGYAAMSEVAKKLL